MKLSTSISTLTIAMITIGTMSAAMALEAYKTPKDQVVVTGLRTQKRYEVKYKTAQGKSGQRKIDTNSCGEALIDQAGKFQAVMIDGQNLDPKKLKVKEHKRCIPPRKTMQSTKPSPSPSPMK